MPIGVEEGAAPFVPDDRTLSVLQEAVQHCRGCDLYQNATQTVFGELKQEQKPRSRRFRS
jgi:DNA polymerase